MLMIATPASDGSGFQQLTHFCTDEVVRLDCDIGSLYVAELPHKIQVDFKMNSGQRWLVENNGPVMSVAIRPASGEICAVVDNPHFASGYDLVATGKGE